MENTPHLYNTLIGVLSQHRNWLDVRHLKTLAWMMVGLMESGRISLTAWAPHVVSRAQYAQSIVRRFRRWLDNENIEVFSLYGPLIQQAISEWGRNLIYLALDTSMLWDTYCMVRISIVYRGRAIPLVWDVLEHQSAQVGYEAYRDLLDRAHSLLPFGCRVVFLADRGVADTDLMKHVKRLGWHYRIRAKKSFGIYRKGRLLARLELSLFRLVRLSSGTMWRLPEKGLVPCIWLWAGEKRARTAGLSSAYEP